MSTNAFSHYLESALINAVLKNTAYTSPATTYLALYTVDPTDSNTGTEVSGSAYARVAITWSAITTNNPSGSTVTNSVQINFAAATGSRGTVAYYGICDAASAGNLLIHGALTTPKTINTGDIAQVAVNGLSLTFD